MAVSFQCMTKSTTKKKKKNKTNKQTKTIGELKTKKNKQEFQPLKGTQMDFTGFHLLFYSPLSFTVPKVT